MAVRVKVRPQRRRVDFNKLQELYIDVLRRAKSSLPAFYLAFLADAERWVKPAKFHYQISEILLNSKKNFAIEAFRESGKSEYVCKAYPLYRLMFPHPESLYIVLILRNQRNATKKLREIAAIHQSEPLFKINTGKVVEQSAEAYEVELRDWEGCRVRIEAYGKGATLRGINWNGRRPDIVIMDDVQDFEDAQSPAILEKDWEWFLSDVKPLGKSTRIFMIGNNLGERCLIERVFEHAQELEFETLRIPAIDDNGQPTWPEKFDLEFLEQEKEAYRKAGKLELWYRERLCKSIASETQTFKREYFRYYSPLEKDRLIRTCNVYAAVDLAISQKETADYSAIAVVAVSATNKWYVLDILYGRWSPSETIDKIFWVVERYKPLKVGIEQVQYQAALSHFLEKEMVRRNKFFSIEELKASKQKELRIKTLEPRFKAGLVYFPDMADWLGELETELLTFPRGKHDDLIDALAYIEQIAEPPEKPYMEWGGSMPAWRAG